MKTPAKLGVTKYDNRMSDNGLHYRHYCSRVVLIIFFLLVAASASLRGESDDPLAGAASDGEGTTKMMGTNSCTGAIGDNSCNGQESCHDNIGIIGHNSCNAFQDCKGNTGTVGHNSCNGGGGHHASTTGDDPVVGNMGGDMGTFAEKLVETLLTKAVEQKGPVKCPPFGC